MIQSIIHNRFFKPFRKIATAIQVRRLRGLILGMHDRSNDPEILQVVDYLRRHPSLELPLGARPPYDYVDGISGHSIEVQYDKAECCPYALVDGNRILLSTGVFK